MLPRGDGAGQHLCEGDLGFKQTNTMNMLPLLISAQILDSYDSKSLTRDIKKSFENAHWDIEIYWILHDTLEDSTAITGLLSSLPPSSYVRLHI